MLSPEELDRKYGRPKGDQIPVVPLDRYDSETEPWVKVVRTETSFVSWEVKLCGLHVGWYSSETEAARAAMRIGAALGGAHVEGRKEAEDFYESLDAPQQPARPVKNQARCSGCQAPIIWQTTSNGKKTPLDPEVIDVIPCADAREEDTVIITASGNYIRGKRVEPGKGQFTGRISHFSTCPKAGQFRRKK